MSSEKNFKKYGIDSSAPHIVVSVNNLGISSASYTFETEGVGPCSGYALISSNKKAAGLYHAAPYPIIDQYEDELKAFSGGFFQPIHSARSQKKEDFEQFLIETLDIYMLPAIALLSENFIDIFFAPALNRIAVFGSSSQKAKQYKFFS